MVYVTSSSGIVKGYILAPILAGVYSGVAMVLADALEGALLGRGWDIRWEWGLVAAVFASVISYIGLALFGLTLHAVLMNFNRYSPLIYCGVAAAVPMCFLAGQLINNMSNILPVALLFSSSAVVCALSFWYFAVYLVSRRAAEVSAEK